jgi:glycosyltransferase 2 family protein
VTRSFKVAFRVAVGLALLAGVVTLADWSSLAGLLRQAHPLWVLAGLLAALTSNVVSALRWRALAQWLGCHMTARQAMRWYFQGMGLNALLPGAVVGGDVYRAMALRQSGAPGRLASWSVLLDRLSGIWMLGTIGALGAAASAQTWAPQIGLPAGWVMAWMLLGAMASLLLPWLLPLALRRWPVQRLGWLLQLKALGDHPRFARHLGWQVWSSAWVQILSACALAAGGYALGITLPPSAWAFAIAPVFLMAALPVSVGGWGTREAAAVVALGLFSIAPAAAVGAAMLYGLYGMAQGLMGALAFGWVGRQGALNAPLPPPSHQA